MENSKSNHRGRATPRGARLTSPLPQTPTECVCDDDVDDGVCLLTHHHHQHQHTHIDNVATFITQAYGVIGARSLITRYGIEAVHALALELYPSWRWDRLKALNNPGGFFAWKLRQLASEQQAPKQQGSRLRVVGQSQENTS